MKQTAMQRLVDHINDRLIASRELVRDTDYIENILANAVNLLNVEREQITDAFHKGREERDYNGSIWECKSGLDYYNQTYNTNEK
jgi:hypothetical protein